LKEKVWLKKFTTPGQLAHKNVPYTVLNDKFLTLGKILSKKFLIIGQLCSRTFLSLTRMNGKKFPIKD
jgi:hypothetical protein